MLTTRKTPKKIYKFKSGDRVRITAGPIQLRTYHIEHPVENRMYRTGETLTICYVKGNNLGYQMKNFIYEIPIDFVEPEFISNPERPDLDEML